MSDNKEKNSKLLFFSLFLFIYYIGKNTRRW